METKKNKHANLGNYRSMIMGFSYLLTLLIVITAFEWKTYDDGVIVIDDPYYGEFEPLPFVPSTEILPPKPKEVVAPELIPVSDDEKIEEEVTIEIGDYNKGLDPIVLLPPPIVEPTPDDVFVFVETPAVPFDGMASFYREIAQKLKYPAQAKRMNVEGRVFVEFVINKDGSITDIKVIKGIGAGCDEEAVKVLEASPPWNPGKQRGVPVRQRMVLPITFKLG